MSFTSEYLALRKKKQQAQEAAESGKKMTKATTKKTDIAPVKKSFSDEYLALREGKEEDIAPISDKLTARMTAEDRAINDKKSWHDGWVDRGAFEDGYQFGDIAKTILGTSKDIRESLYEGVLGMAESTIDAGAYIAGTGSGGVGGVGGTVSDPRLIEKLQNGAQKFIAKDIINEEKIAKAVDKLTGGAIPGGGLIAEAIMGDENSDDYSLLGQKADSVLQSGGQLAGQMALQAAGVPWWVTSGVTSFGGEAENAFNQNATYGEAGVSGLISAGAEILTEKISGGIKFGGQTLDDLAKPFLRSISDKALRTAAALGLDIAGEGMEEVLSGLASALGQKLTYASGKDFKELYSSEDAWTNFISGALLSGGTNSAKAVNSAVTGTDYSTGLTANEQKVAEKVYNDRIAEATKGGKRLKAAEKNKIFDEVVKELEKGYISTDTIEEVLGGEEYKTYKETADSEDAVKKEYEDLGKKVNPTLADQNRYAELGRKVEDMKKNNWRDQAKSQISQNVFDQVKNDRLAESYNEKTRRGQAFKADVSQYDESQRQTIQNAIDCGILNNTNRTHEMVDFIAKVSADRGVLFDFTDNERIKGSSFAVEGKTVNGYKTDGGIVINVDSPKYLEATVGHEITHVLEGTELYQALQATLFEYARIKGEYDSRLANVTKLYEGVEGADIDGELTADLVGDYLFTDADFVKNLSVQHRNVFQKIFDEIKYLCKVATTGSKEARQLERVKKAFEDVYRTAVKVEKNTAGGGVKYSLSSVDYPRRMLDYKNTAERRSTEDVLVNDLINRGKVTVVNVKDIPANIDTVNWNDKDEARGCVREILKKFLGENVVFNLGENSAIAYLTTRGIDHAVAGANTKEKATALSQFYSLVSKAEYCYSCPADSHSQNSNNADWDYFVSVAKVGKKTVPLVFAIRSIDQDVRSQIYNIATKMDPAIPRGDGTQETPANAHPSYGDSPSLKASVPQEVPGVKQHLLTDVTEEQNEHGLDADGEAVRSLSNVGDIPYGNRGTLGEEVKLRKDIAPIIRKGNPVQEAPIRETVAKNATPQSAGKVAMLPDDFAPAREDISKQGAEDIGPVAKDTPIKTVKDRLQAKLSNSQTELANVERLREEAYTSYSEAIAKAQAEYDAKKKKDTKAANDIRKRIERLQRYRADVDADYAKRISDIESRITKTGSELQKDHTKRDRLERAIERIDKTLELEKADLAEEFNQKKEQLKNKGSYISQKASELYREIRELKKGVRASDQLAQLLDSGYEWSAIRSALVNIKHTPDGTVNVNSAVESIARQMLNEDYENSLYNLDSDYQKKVKELEEAAERDRSEARKAEQRTTRKELHQNILNRVKSVFELKGLDLDNALRNAKNLSTFATVDNTPQRVMEKSLGYKEGQLLSDLTVNQVAQNETRGIKWLNSFTDRKNGLLARISKQYHIKPGSKQSAAAQMYAEGFYVDEKNNIIQYGDRELAMDFPDAQVQRNIKGLAGDPRIRQIYDDTLAMINESRKRNAYPEIPRLDNYFLHFRAMDDTFSRLGLPFNPNDIRAKDLPTDLNGVTADLKPGQPYFASAMHRTGKRTSFDLLGGLERYLTSAKNQIYHIDDIQTLRALRNYIADTYGQANGLEGLDALSEEEAQERIEKVYNSHLSTFAKFLNEEANILAGKTALIDRGLEGIIGRRGISFLNTVNGQVGSNMVGFNISSSLTNFLPVAQTFAKTQKRDFIKAFGQTVAHKVGSIFGRSDDFTENSPVVIRRKGSDRFYRTPWQKLGDPGYALMGLVDDISTELIARTKYNELTRKGMNPHKAHYETDKWVSRLMGDRSLGQQPQLYNSKMLGLITKFQLEVRNQLDSQFYDTIQEAKVSNEHIQNALKRNAKTAAKVTSTFVQLAVAQHLFGRAFESVAGYNPAFDIIEVIIKACGFDDDEESEDTVLDNIEQGFFALLEDLPYTSTFTGGRIPIESALPVEQFIMGEDEYGNEKSRWETLAEAAPYYLLPGGYGQAKKTIQGLSMFDDDLPIAGSYTDSGNLRFPVDETVGNMVQAGIFGQYASPNARDYFDNERTALNEKQTREFAATGMPIQEYWDYRDGLKGLKTLAEKFDYIDSLDLTTRQKNILVNNLVDREDPVDMTDYSKYSSYEEFDFASKNAKKYAFLEANDISYADYSASEDSKAAYTWAFDNPEKYTVSKAISKDFVEYYRIKGELNDIRADKDGNGNSISGTAKKKKIEYIDNLDLAYGQKIILYKSLYPSDDTYNYDIISYLNSRKDIGYQEMETILTELGFKVDSEGNITW